MAPFKTMALAVTAALCTAVCAASAAELLQAADLRLDLNRRPLPQPQVCCVRTVLAERVPEGEGAQADTLILRIEVTPGRSDGAPGHGSSARDVTIRLVTEDELVDH